MNSRAPNPQSLSGTERAPPLITTPTEWNNNISVDLRLTVRVLVALSPSLRPRLSRWLDDGLVWSSSERSSLMSLCALLLVSEPSMTRAMAVSLGPLVVPIARLALGLSSSPQDHSPSVASVPSYDLDCLSLLVHAAPACARLVWESAQRRDALIVALESTWSSTSEPSALTHSLCSLYRLILCSASSSSSSQRVAVSEWRKLSDWRSLFELTAHSDVSVSSWAREISALVLGASEAQRSSQRTTASELALGAWLDSEAQSLHVLTSQRSQLLVSEPSSSQSASLSASASASSPWLFTARDLPSAFVSVLGVLVSTRHSVPETLSNASSSLWVDTPSSQRHLAQLALALSAGRAVLLEGPSGSGKSSLVSALAQRVHVHRSELTRVHLTAQSDAKLLLGTYVVTEVPGEFRWVPGVLVRAVTLGHWLVLENVDAAPVEVQSLLLPLLERRELFVPGRGELLRAHEHFALFGTRVLTSTPTSASHHKRVLHDALWCRVHVSALSDSDLRLVLHHVEPVLLELLLSAARAAHADTRAVLKVATRVQRLVRDHSLSESLRDASHVSSSLREACWLECVDSWFGALADSSQRSAKAQSVARVWQVSEERASYFLTAHKPSADTEAHLLRVGRAALPLSLPQPHSKSDSPSAPFAQTRTHAQLLEKVSRAVQCEESVLLVGETGVGKTTSVQQLASLLGQRLVVLNLNQQTDSADLLGGFKPVDLAHFVRPLASTFESLFGRTFSAQKNSALLLRLQQSVARSEWRTVLAVCSKTLARVHALDREEVDPVEPKRARKESGRGLESTLLAQWATFASQLARLERVLAGSGSGSGSAQAFAFAFVEGALVSAVREGSWVLLDEVNLASEETLESLSALLEGGSLWLAERGDLEPLPRHPNFKLFACMNPPTDVGKRDLPPGVRSHFTELFVDEVESPEDLQSLVRAYVPQLSSAQQGALVTLFLKARKEAASGALSDGNGQRPRYTLRTLSRALQVTRSASAHWGVARALHEGAALAFLTQLDSTSHALVTQLIATLVPSPTFHGDAAALPALPLLGDVRVEHVRVEGVWLPRGPETPSSDAHFIVTATVGRQLKALARLVSAARYPVLLQGPTSAGKTSMVVHLARVTGHRCVRINNHEHTDLQEYLGQYVTDAATGALRFHEGALVTAVREGQWLILDELNLAPSDVLEALNRLLDDNRELFVPETQQRLTPHPHFMLFATQNPAGLYGGRKPLSRAFRNRFVELHFEELSGSEVEQILRERTALPPRLAASLVSVMKDLQRQRAQSSVFAGKHGSVTLRDLFRWAERIASSSLSSSASGEVVATEGFMLLAERLRNDTERLAVQRVLEQHFKVSLDMDALYARESQRLLHHAPHASTGLVWTAAAQRVLVLLERALRHGESALLVGDTGVGKTSVALALAALRHQRAHVLNCHQHTETGDLLGALRPARNKEHVRETLLSTVQLACSRASHCSESLTAFDVPALLEHARLVFAHVRTPGTPNTVQAATLALERPLARQQREYEALFAWSDGPLVTAMKRGDLFVLDEISLAEDAVLERLNSVLEPSRTLTLAEKGGARVEELTANVDFRLVATMNPGGDYGKKELSPALRNRFTEFWVPAIKSDDDLKRVLAPTLRPSLHVDWLPRVLAYARWYNGEEDAPALTLRDLLAWTRFLEAHVDSLGPSAAFAHGAALVALDALGMSHAQHRGSRATCEEHLLAFLPPSDRASAAHSLRDASLGHGGTHIGAFALPLSSSHGRQDTTSYAWSAATTQRNLLRLVRALAVPRKAVLLEGSPGVGKTSLVVALAALCGQRVTRINLSEQSDMMDLLGADLPEEHADALAFRWRDGPFLAALERGEWVLLDELNLASQSVLEGLNAALDHRGSVFVPELSRTFACAPGFRIFATQNPLTQGGGRKGLPRSFLNRFTKVFVDTFDAPDLLHITQQLHPSLSTEHALGPMVAFTEQLHTRTMVTRAFGERGAPWEFNLRDVLRWADLTRHAHPTLRSGHDLHGDTLFAQRFRTRSDRAHVHSLYKSATGNDLSAPTRARISLSATTLHAGLSATERSKEGHDSSSASTWGARVLHRHSVPLASLQRCVQLAWPALLVGASGSGKSALVRSLAAVSGQELLTMHLSASMDASELLGSYEQLDLGRQRRVLLSDVEERVRSECARSLSEPSSLSALTSLHSAWYRTHLRSSSSSSEDPSSSLALDAELVALLERVLSLLSDSSVDSASSLRSRLHALQHTATRAHSGQFEWVDGPLVRAVREGHWLLLDNANLCAPAVLDRLNPLLERGGVLVLSERGLVNGELVTLTPHPNFRIFLAMDPSHGEISRAMRNRALEVSLLDDHDEPCPLSSHDVLSLMPSLASYSTLRARLVTLHQELTPKATTATTTSALRALSELGQVVAHQLELGTPLHVSLTRAAELVYQHVSSVHVSHALAKLFPTAHELSSLSVSDARAVLVDSSSHSALSSARDELSVLRELISQPESAPHVHSLVKHVLLRATTSSVELRVALLDAVLLEEAHDPKTPSALRAYMGHAAVRALVHSSSHMSSHFLPHAFDPSALPLDLRYDDALVTELRLRSQDEEGDVWLAYALRSELVHALWSLTCAHVHESDPYVTPGSALSRARQFTAGSLSAPALGSELLIQVIPHLQTLDRVLDALTAHPSPSVTHVSLVRDLIAVRVAFASSLSSQVHVDPVAFSLWVLWLSKLSLVASPLLAEPELRAALEHSARLASERVSRVLGAPSRWLLWKRGSYSSGRVFLDSRVASVDSLLRSAASRPGALTSDSRRLLTEALASLHALGHDPKPNALLDTLTALSQRITDSASSPGPHVDVRVSSLAAHESLRWQVSLVLALWSSQSQSQSESQSALVSLASEIDAFVSFSLDKAQRSPLELAPFVRARWLLLLNDPKKFSTHVTSLRVTLMGDLLRSLWEPMRAGLTLSPSPSRYASSEALRLTDGPLALTLAAETSLSAHTFVLDEERVSIADRDAHVASVRALLRFLVHDAVAVDTSARLPFALSDTKSTWALVLAALRHTFGALESELSDPVPLRALLDLVAERLVSSSIPHTSFSLSSLPSMIEAVRASLASCRDLHVHSLLSAHFEPVLALVNDALSASHPAPLVASRALIHVAQLRVALLMPSQPVHPRAFASLRLATLRAERERVRGETEALRLLERRVSDRDAHTPLLDALAQQVSDLDSRITHLESKVDEEQGVLDSTSFSSLFASLQQLDSTLLSSSRVSQIVESASSVRSWSVAQRLLAHEQQWQRSTAGALTRLSLDHATLTPIHAPLTSAVHELRLALRLHVHAATSLVHVDVTYAGPTLVRSLLAWPSLEQDSDSESSQSIGTEQLASLLNSHAERIGAPRALVSVRSLQSQLLRVRLARVHVDSLPVRTLSALFDTYTRLCARDAEEAAERAVEAVHVRVMERTIESDEAREERRFRQLFPDFEGAYADLLRDDDAMVEDDHNLEEEEDKHKGQEPLASMSSVELEEFERVRDAEVSQIVRAHSALVASRASLSQRASLRRSALLTAELARAFNASYRTATELQRATVFQMPVSLDAPSRVSHVLAGALASHRLSSEQSLDSLDPLMDSSALRFYSRTSPLEAGLLLSPLRSLIASVTSLLDQFAQNALLLMVQRVSERVLELPLSAPMAKALAGVELVLQKAQLWNETAPVSLSLHSELGALLALVSRWRRQELEHWPRLLTDKEREFRVRAQRTWPSWYARLSTVRALQVPSERASALKSVLADLGRFCEGSPWGELEARLDLLRLFGEHARLEGQDDIARIMLNTQRYYAQYTPSLTQRIQDERTPLEKAMKDKVTLGRWEDRDTYRLKEQSTKSHRQLAKLAHDYEKILLRPLTAHLDALHALERNAPTLEHTPKTQRAEKLEALLVTHTESLEPRSAAEKVARASARVVRVHVLTPMLSALPPSTEGIATLSASLLRAVAEMRALTSRRQRPRKKRALVATLKQLQAMGLIWHRERLGPDSLREIGHVLATHKPLTITATTTMDVDATSLQSADGYFYRALGAVQKARVAAMTAHVDLTRLEVLQARGLVEHALENSLAQRAALTDALGSLESLTHVTALLDMAHKAQDPLRSLSEASAWSARVSALNVLARSLAQLGVVFANVPEVSALAVTLTEARDAALTHLDALESALRSSSLSPPLDASAVPSRVLVTPLLSSCVTQGIASLSSQRVKVLSALSESAVARSLVTAQVRAHLEHSFDEAISPLDMDTATASVTSPEAKEARVTAFVTEYQLAVQRLKAVFTKANEDKEEDGNKDKKAEILEDQEDEGKKEEEEDMFETLNLAQSHAQHLATLTALDLPRLVRALSSLLEGEVVANASLSTLARQLVSLAAVALRSVARFHREHVKFLFVGARLLSSLLAEGFCTANERNEDDQGNEDEAQDGEVQLNDEEAGLGEGKGAKDVSDKLEDEERALGEKPLKEEEQEEQGEDMEEVEGLEMENDFDGEMRDLDRDDMKPKEEDEDEDQEEEEKSLDKEMGETNAAQEEIVDEKLWSDDEEEGEDKEGEDKAQPKELEETQKAPKDKSKQPREQELAANEDEHKTKDLEEQGASEKEQTKEGDKDKEDQEGEGEEEGDEEEEEPEKEEGANERYAVPPRAPDEEYDLPEELKLDDEEEEGEGDQGEEKQEDEEEGDGDDAMDVDQEDKEGFDDMPEDTDQAQPNQQDQDQEQDQEEGGDDAMSVDQDENPLGQELKDDEAMDQEEEDDLEEEEGEQEGAPAFDTVERSEDEEGHEDEDAFGVDEEHGDATQAQNVAPQQQRNEDKEKNKKREPRDEAQQSAEQPEERTEEGQGERRTGRDSHQGAKPREQQRAPNPYRSLGDALQHWQRQLNVLDKEKELNKDNKDKEDDKEEEGLQDGGEEDAPKDALFEYMDQEEREAKADAQVLGIATEEQLQPLHRDQEEEERRRLEEEDQEREENLDEEDDMDVDHEDEEKEGRGGSAESAQLASMKRPQRKERKEKEDSQEESDQEGQEDGHEQDQMDHEEEEAKDDALLHASLVAKGAVPSVEAEARVSARDAAAVAALRSELSARVTAAAQLSLDSPAALEAGMAVWRGLQRLTSALAQELAEQLRLLLEPTLAAKLRGDYRSGKRLNMRKVIPYIASQFRKDKIWLRRTQPSKREYQVLVGVDDSESVALGGAGELLREALATLVQALTLVEVGQLGVARFGADVELLHALDEPWGDARAAALFPQLAFTQQRTDLVRFLERAVPLLEAARSESRAQNAAELRQLLFVVGDGRFGSERSKLKRWLRRAHEAHITVVYLAIDAPNNNDTSKEAESKSSNPNAKTTGPQAVPKKRESLLDIQSVSWNEGKMALTAYMDDFPFDLYLIVRDAAALPRVLADALRQWFELSAGGDAGSH